MNFTKRSFNKKALAFLPSLTCISYLGSASGQLPPSLQSTLKKPVSLILDTDIPIGIGLDPTNKHGNQSDWLGEYHLDDYPGEVHEDGVQILIDTIKQLSEPVTLLCIGPVMNIAEALRREPSIAEDARFIGMHGSIRIGYDGEKLDSL